MQITPGYDFTTHETPTRVKLQTMLGGMSITGIDISQIDSTLIGIKIANSSNASALAEGWIWNDDNNALWVLNDKGWVQIFRANWGGFESRRFTIIGTLTDTQGLSGASSTKTWRPGTYVEMNPIASDTKPTSFGFGLGHEGHRAYFLETGYSCATPISAAFPRLCHRGGYVYRSASSNGRSGAFPDYQAQGAINNLPLTAAATVMEAIALRGAAAANTAQYCWNLGHDRVQW